MWLLLSTGVVATSSGLDIYIFGACSGQVLMCWFDLITVKSGNMQQLDQYTADQKQYAPSISQYKMYMTCYLDMF